MNSLMKSMEQTEYQNNQLSFLSRNSHKVYELNLIFLLLK